ncbi:hypothetical protein M413DRAFT_194663 [Hebeloma cylindrosporum]|uniref:Uncharacterized protein n=1 Tax=Hebeloma cylindrosporum TaxID=76867 RepID=A0A0C3C611_HEBCY|nr:hypothetical protein M413DRAFT_194663 [Hebeloma cylindrosporum h7]
MNDSEEPEVLSIGCLYLAGFAQARAPHVGLIIPSSTSTGTLVHIRIDRESSSSPNWARQVRTQKIEGDMFLTSLLKIGGPTARELLIEVSKEVPVPENNEFGECFPWVMALVRILHERGVVEVSCVDDLATEFAEFIEGNKGYARRDRFPRVATSKFCSVACY